MSNFTNSVLSMLFDGDAYMLQLKVGPYIRIGRIYMHPDNNNSYAVETHFFETSSAFRQFAIAQVNKRYPGKTIQIDRTT